MDYWYAFLHWLFRHLYFEKIRVLNRERLPAKGPTLYLCLHRNGAVDGFVYRHLDEQGRFLISTQLRRSLFGRLIFRGIEIQRSNDEAGPRGTEKVAAMHQCLEALERGENIFLFPEGTSSLGPRHLPFQPGAAHLLAKFVERNSAGINVVPLGIFYHAPESFRSRVEVMVGEPISTSFQEPISHGQRVREFQTRITMALEKVGINFTTPEAQLQTEQTAKIICHDERPCFPILKELEPGLSPDLQAASSHHEKIAQENQLNCFQNVPLFPNGSRMVSLAFVFFLSLLVLPGLLLNALPLLAGWWASKRFARERNVISLWKIVVGIPVFLITFSTTFLVTGLIGWACLGAYLVFTVLAWRLYRTWKRHGVECLNGWFHPEARESVANSFAEIRLHFRGPDKVDEVGKSAPRPAFELLPHEMVFGLFMGLTWTRLVASVGFLHPVSLAWLGGLALTGLLLWWAGRESTPYRWRIRLFAYFLVMNACYAGLKEAVPLIQTDYRDQWLMGLDSMILGGNLSLGLASNATPFLTDLFSFCYLFFFPYLILSLVFHGCRNLETFKQFCLGLFSIYGIGFIGYTLAPAVGPYLFIPELMASPLEGGWLTRLNAGIVRMGSNGVDVFPSLHTAVTCFILFFDRKRSPGRFKLFLLPVLGLWISTIYLRYHYAVDLVAGFLLAAAAFVLIENWKRFHQPKETTDKRRWRQIRTA